MAAAAGKRIITVFGATGAQGGSVARALLNQPDGAFAVRAVTRNPGGAKAAALREAGAEVVAANMSSPAEVRAALEGAYGSFVVTQFWEKMDANEELKQGRQIAQAALAAGLKHVVFSSLEDSRPLNRDGKLADGSPLPPLADPEGEAWIIPHFDAKGAIRQYMIDAGVPATYVQMSCYLDNLLGMMQPQRQEDGSRVIALPMADKATGWMAIDDCGEAVKTIFEHPDEHMSKTYGLAGENITTDELAATLSRVTGEPFVYVPIPMETMASFGFPGADDLARMFGALYCAPEHCVRDPKLTRLLNPKTKSVAEWAEAHKEDLTQA